MVTSLKSPLRLSEKSKPAKSQEAQFTIGDYALIGKFIKMWAWKSVNSLEQLGF